MEGALCFFDTSKAKSDDGQKCTLQFRAIFLSREIRQSKKLKLVVPVDVLQGNPAINQAKLDTLPMRRWGNKITAVHVPGKTLRIPE